MWKSILPEENLMHMNVRFNVGIVNIVYACMKIEENAQCMNNFTVFLLQISFRNVVF